MARLVRNKGAKAQKRPEPMPAQPALTPDLPAPEVIEVRTGRIACDGVGGALGHPKVWYDMAEQDHVECKYCDRVFALKGGSRDPGH